MLDTDIMPRATGHMRPGDGIRKILTDPDTYATTMLVLAGELLDPGFLNWHPGTILAELERVSGADVPQLNFDRLMAAVAIKTTDLFWKQEDRFVALCNVLAGTPFDPDTFDPADAVEVAWGITEALVIDPPDGDDPEPFSDAVRHYVGMALLAEGMIRPPDVLRIAIGGNATARVRRDYGHDPDRMTGIAAEQERMTREVEEAVRDGLDELFAQLDALPLREGSTAELKRRIGVVSRAAGK